ncbi:RES domain-containing protein [Verminephrobacter aporrectodeae]|uniref:RES domain-containing protein n=1 Tax=Verminephrobacter aporrectodeae TaxID=1110389 RepID=UPI0022448D9C|nr:RES domain-containing protein [Verminephrobacter aporrectodeae]
MILADLPAGTTLFRAHAPQWASRPTSGAGAAAKGGRFNREGVEALYLSLDEITALREYQQTSSFLPPCTIVLVHRGVVRLGRSAPTPPWRTLGYAVARLARGLAPSEVRDAHRTSILGAR